MELVGNEACHPPAHGLAADQQRRTAFGQRRNCGSDTRPSGARPWAAASSSPPAAWRPCRRIQSVRWRCSRSASSPAMASMNGVVMPAPGPVRAQEAGGRVGGAGGQIGRTSLICLEIRCAPMGSFPALFLPHICQANCPGLPFLPAACAILSHRAGGYIGPRSERKENKALTGRPVRHRILPVKSRLSYASVLRFLRSFHGIHKRRVASNCPSPVVD